MIALSRPSQAAARRRKLWSEFHACRSSRRWPSERARRKNRSRRTNSTCQTNPNPVVSVSGYYRTMTNHAPAHAAASALHTVHCLFLVERPIRHFPPFFYPRYVTLVRFFERLASPAEYGIIQAVNAFVSFDLTPVPWCF